MSIGSPSFWMNVPIIKGKTSDIPKRASVVIIGSGLTGVSVGYFLQTYGFSDVLIVDHEPEASASYRNCGHILYGTVESMKAMVEIHGAPKARELWQFSTEICDQIESTVQKLSLDADYRREGYLVIANSFIEDQECRESVELLNSMGFASQYWAATEVRKLGFQNCFGARFEAGSAQAHPVKFRNGVLQEFLRNQGGYASNVHVHDILETADGVDVVWEKGVIHADAVVIAANAYSPLFSGFFRSRNLIDPFRGQIIASQPLRHQFSVRYPHSFDHGYEYAIVSEDNRLIIGGWRNHSSTGEVGTYSLDVNPLIEQGLKEFVKQHYLIDEPVEWDFSWSGIMAASKTGLPFIGNTTAQRIYCCAGFTGHGFSWGHGCADVLAKMIAGLPVPSVAKYFNPRIMT